MTLASTNGASNDAHALNDHWPVRVVAEANRSGRGCRRGRQGNHGKVGQLVTPADHRCDASTAFGLPAASALSINRPVILPTANARMPETCAALNTLRTVSWCTKAAQVARR